MTKAREGFNSLLELKPDAEIVEIVHQHLKHVMFEDYRKKNPDAAQVFMPEPDGPWTLITLMEGKQFKAYAIHNLTGNVYKMGEDGAVEDDPFIEVTLLSGGVDGQEA